MVSQSPPEWPAAQQFQIWAFAGFLVDALRLSTLRNYGGLVGIWETKTGKERVLPRVHTDQIRAVAVSPDGTRIASGSADQTIVIWDAQGKPLGHLRGHRNQVP